MMMVCGKLLFQHIRKRDDNLLLVPLDNDACMYMKGNSLHFSLKEWGLPRDTSSKKYILEHRHQCRVLHTQCAKPAL